MLVATTTLAETEQQLRTRARAEQKRIESETKAPLSVSYLSLGSGFYVYYFKGHEYLQVSGSSMIHSESCEHPKHITKECKHAEWASKFTNETLSVERE